MSRGLRVDPKDAAPIWSQIEEGVRRLIATGALAPGASVPSVRDLARDLGVNPATVSKAYQRLADTGVLEVRRGDGTYVSSAPPAIRRAERERLLCQGALRYASLAMTLGASRSEVLAEVEQAWARMDREKKGSK